MNDLFDKYMIIYYLKMFELGKVSLIGTYRMSDYLTPDFFNKLATIVRGSHCGAVISEEINNLSFGTRIEEHGIYISTRKIAKFRLHFEHEYCPYILKRRKRKTCIVITHEIIKEVENQYGSIRTIS